MNFDRLAPHYDWLEAATAGGRLQRARTQWLDALKGRLRILSVGEGHGRFAAACLTRFPEAELTCVDASAAMQAVAQRRCQGLSGRVYWENREILAWQPPRKYDAIVTCFFLDCFPPETLAAVMNHLAGAATEDAVWLHTDFAMPEKGLARLRSQAVHALMYAFFRVFTALPARKLTAPDREFARHGFERSRRADFEWGLIRAELWQRREKIA